MSLKANYFKLGLFVVGAVIAGVIVLVVIGSGRWFQPRLTIETYFNESVQGLDVGSKLKYRGVVIGEVKSIGFTYNKYQQDKPMQQRARYVLVEAQIQPKLLGGRAGAGDLTEQKSANLEIERGLRMRLAPQGITGTSYLEIDYVEPAPPTLADRLDPGQRLHPQRAVDGDGGRQCRDRPPDPAAQHGHRGDDHQSQYAARHDQREGRRGRHQGRFAARRPGSREDGDLARQSRDQAPLRPGCRAPRRAPCDDRRAQEDGREPGAAEAARGHGGRGGAGARDPRRSQRQRVARASVADAHQASTGSSAAGRRISPSRSTTCARSPTTCAISPKRPSATPPT